MARGDSRRAWSRPDRRSEPDNCIVKRGVDFLAPGVERRQHGATGKCRCRLARPAPPASCHPDRRDLQRQRKAPRAADTPTRRPVKEPGPDRDGDGAKAGIVGCCRSSALQSMTAIKCSAWPLPRSEHRAAKFFPASPRVVDAGGAEIGGTVDGKQIS